MRPLALASALLVALPARASGHCVEDYEVSSWLRPSEQDQAPTNVLIWLLVDDHSFGPWVDPATASETVGLETLDGQVVPLAVEGEIHSPAQSALALRPAQDLLSDTGYVARWSDYEGSFERTASFHTLDGPDDEPPSIPQETGGHSLRSEPVTIGGTCWPGYLDRASFGVDPADDWQLAVGGVPDRDEHWPGGPWADIGGMADDGRVEMIGTFQPGGKLEYRFASLDLAGNFSGWSETHAVTMPLAGCTSTRASWLPLLLPLLVLRGSASGRARR